MDNVHFIWMHKTIKNLDKQKREIYLCWIGSGGHEVRGGRIFQTFSDSKHNTTIFNLQNMLWSLKDSLLICRQISQITDWIYYITLTLSFRFLCPSLFFFLLFSPTASLVETIIQWSNQNQIKFVVTPHYWCTGTAHVSELLVCKLHKLPRQYIAHMKYVQYNILLTSALKPLQLISLYLLKHIQTANTIKKTTVFAIISSSHSSSLPLNSPLTEERVQMWRWEIRVSRIPWTQHWGSCWSPKTKLNVA